MFFVNSLRLALLVLLQCSSVYGRVQVEGGRVDVTRADDDVTLHETSG